MGAHKLWLLATIMLFGAALVALAVLVKEMTSRHSRLEAQWNDNLMTVGLALSIASILAATLIPGASSEGEPLLLNPTTGMDELQAPANVVLFVPLGGLLYLKGVSRLRTMLLAAALSIAIEMLQFFVIEGRSTSTSDVILNTAGAFMGHVVIGHARSASRS